MLTYVLKVKINLTYIHRLIKLNISSKNNAFGLGCCKNNDSVSEAAVHFKSILCCCFLIVCRCSHCTGVLVLEYASMRPFRFSNRLTQEERIYCFTLIVLCFLVIPTYVSTVFKSTLHCFPI